MSRNSSRFLALRVVLVLALTLLVALVPIGAAFAATDGDVEETSTEAAAADDAAAADVADEAAEEVQGDETEAPAEETTEVKATDEAGEEQATAADDSADKASANDSGPYDSTSDGSPSGNGNGDNDNSNKPCAGCVGDADDKNPPGQLPGPEDENAGYECDANSGVGQTNPAHSGCKETEPTDPKIHLEKDGPATSRVGDTIEYTFEVTNTGDVDLTDVHVTDPLLGNDEIEVTPSSLPAGSSGVIVVAKGSAEYTVLAADVVDSKVDNTATAHGTDPDGDEVTDVDDHTVTIPTVVEEDKATICHATGSAKNPFVVIGPSPVGVIMGHVGVSHQDGRDIIPPFTQPDGTPFPGQNWDAAGQAIFDAGCVIEFVPTISLEKDGPATSRVGDTITYTFDVTNTGDLPLTDVHITDDLITDDEIAVTPSSLAPGEDGTATATYTVDAADVVANAVHNTATVHGTDPDGDEVTDVDDHTVTIPTVVEEDKATICHATGSAKNPFVVIGPSPVGVIMGHVGVSHQDGRDIIPPFTQPDGTPFPGQNWDAAGQAIFDAGCVIEFVPTISLEKDGPATSRVGDTITYTFDVTNTGDLPLTDVHITDDLITDDEIAVTPSSLAPGEDGTATATYTVDAADVVANAVHNTATVHGTDPDGDEVTDVDDHTVKIPFVVVEPQPGIELIKDGPAEAREGDEITYTFEVTNIGKSTLTNVHVTDPMLGTGDIAITPSTLAPGESGTGSATYTITAADAEAGSVHNTATAIGTPPTGGDVSDTDDHTVLVPDIPDAPVPGIRLEKSGPETAKVGDTITYRFRVTNTGETTLSNVSITDAKLGLDNLAVTPSMLEPGESGTASATYTVLRKDLRRGFIHNTAVATGTPPKGDPIDDEDDHTTEILRPIVPPVPPVPPLPSTGIDAGTTLLLAALTLLIGFGLLRVTRLTATPSVPQTWSITNAPSGGHTPPPVHRRTSKGFGTGGGWTPRPG